MRIDDITDQVHEQAAVLRDPGVEALRTPAESVFPVSPEAAAVLGMPTG